MKKAVFWLFCSLTLVNPILAQKASLRVKLIDSSFASFADYIFQVEVKNDSFPTYWIQDTARLRSQVDYTGTGLLYVILEKNVAGKYKSYEKVKRHQGDVIRDSCMDHCCNCLYLQKGETVRMNIPLLQRFIFEPGEYRMEVTLAPPLESCNDCEELRLGEIYTDYYFRVPSPG